MAEKLRTNLSSFKDLDERGEHIGEILSDYLQLVWLVIFGVR